MPIIVVTFLHQEDMETKFIKQILELAQKRALGYTLCDCYIAFTSPSQATILAETFGTLNIFCMKT